MKYPKLFYGFTFLFIMINALILNDVTSLWEGAESYLAWQALHNTTTHTPYEFFISLSFGNGQINTFWMRLPGILLLLGAIALFWWAGKQIFGQKVSLNTVALLGTSLLVINISKVASADIWALASHWMMIMLLLRYLKQPRTVWMISFHAALFLSLWIQPISALILILSLSTWLYYFHPQGNRLWRLQSWGGAIAYFGILYVAALIRFDSQSFLVSWQPLKYLGWNFIGVLPFIGFALAGIWESIQKFRKREELAVIMIGMLLSTLIAHSWSLQMVLVLLAARQLEQYFHPNNPYRNIVRGAAVLHLIIVVFVIILALIWAFAQFLGVGFRAGLAAGGLYWMWSFVAIIGLYGMNERYVKTGTIMSGLLFCTLFWLQAGPVLQSKLSWPSDLLKEAMDHPKVKAQGEELNCILLNTTDEPMSPLAPYAKAAYSNTSLLDTPEQVLATAKNDTTQSTLYLLPSSIYHEPLSPPDSTKWIKGWNSRLKPVEYAWKLENDVY
jgi:hypothetical protein